MLFSLQNCLNSNESWLSWSSKSRRRCVPTVRLFVCVSKYFNQSKPISFVVQPLSLNDIAQSYGKSSSNHAERWYFPAKITNGGIAQPWELTPIITVTHSRLPGCTDLGRLRRS